METQYLSSEKVKAFPASWRSADSGDPESSLTTETSLRRLAYARFSHRSTAYIDPSSNEFVIVVDGYVFVVDPLEDEDKSTNFLKAIGNIIDKFPGAKDADTFDIYAGITVAAMGMTVGKTQYDPENGLFEQLKSSKDNNNVLDGDGSFYGLQLFDSLTSKPTGLSAYLHILHKDKDKAENEGWSIPEESRFVTDTNQVQNRGGNVSIGTRLDTKEVYATPSGEMTEPTEPPYSRLDSDGLKVASSQDPGKVFSIEAHADKISLSAPTDGDPSEARLTKSAESLTISDDAKIEVSAPTVSINDGEGNSIGMSKGGPIEVVGANGISLDNSSASEPITAKSSKITMKSQSVKFESDSDSSEANVGVTGTLSVSHRGVFGTNSDGSGDASVSAIAKAVSLFWNGMEYKAIEVKTNVLFTELFESGLMQNDGDSYRSFFLVQGVPLQGVYTSSDGEGLTPLKDDGNYSQLWDLTFTFQPVSETGDFCLAAGRLIGEWHGKAREGTIENVLDANGFPYDATMNSLVGNKKMTAFANLLGTQVRTSTIPLSMINGWFNN